MAAVCGIGELDRWDMADAAAAALAGGFAGSWDRSRSSHWDSVLGGRVVGVAACTAAMMWSLW